MIEKLGNNVERQKVWSQHTTYPSAVGLHSEVSTNALAMNASTNNDLSRTCLQIESLHRREMKLLRNDRKHLEDSMLAYTERMRRIACDKVNQGLVKAGRIKDNSPTRKEAVSSLHVYSEQKAAVSRQKKYAPPSHGTGSVSLLSARKLVKRSVSVSPKPNRKLNDVIVRPRTDDRPTLSINYSSTESNHDYSNKECSREFEGITGVWHTKGKEQQSTFQPSKITAAMPIATFKSVYSIDESRDSGYSSTDGSVSERSEMEHPQEANIIDAAKESDLNRIKIVPFPDIPIPKQTRNDKRNEIKGRISFRKLQKENTLLYKSFERTPRNRVCVKETVAISKRKKKGRKILLVRKTFKYSYAVEELLRKPDLVKNSDTVTVSKIEVHKGQLVQTLGPGVLTIKDVNDTDNLQGLKINRKRDCLSAPIPLNPHLKEPEKSCLRPKSEIFSPELKKAVDFTLPDIHFFPHQMSDIFEEPEKLGSSDESINRQYNKCV